MRVVLLSIIAGLGAIACSPRPPQIITVPVFEHQWEHTVRIETYQPVRRAAYTLADVPDDALDVQLVTEQRDELLVGALCEGIALAPVRRGSPPITRWSCSYYTYDAFDWEAEGIVNSTPHTTVRGTGKDGYGVVPKPEAELNLNTCADLIAGCERFSPARSYYRLAFDTGDTPPPACLVDDDVWLATEIGDWFQFVVEDYALVCESMRPVEGAG